MTAGCLDAEKKANLVMLIRWVWMWKRGLMMQCSSLCQQSCLFVTRGAVLFQTKAGVDSGSETDNEQMEVPEEAAAAAAESLKNNNSPSKPGAVPLQQNEEDYASDGSSDILQPTQVSSSSMAVAALVLFL